MPDGEKPNSGFVLINIDTESLGDAAKLFIEKISSAIGGYTRPWQIRRVAAAEADAKMIHAQEEIRITTLQKRAAQRWLDEETQKQANMEAITAQAVPEIKESAKPDKIENDWLVNFFDKARLTSDGEMQRLWAKILAGEANTPGKFAKRTINLVASLEKEDAEKFQTLCKFNWLGFHEPAPIVFDSADSIYVQNGLTWATLRHLEDIGLASFESLVGLEIGRQPQNSQPKHWSDMLLPAGYGGEHYMLYPGPAGKKLPIGKVKFTRPGIDLVSICAFVPVAGFAEYVVSKWEAAGVKVKKMKSGETMHPVDFGIVS